MMPPDFSSLRPSCELEMSYIMATNLEKARNLEYSGNSLNLENSWNSQ